MTVNGMICILEYVTLPGEILPRLQHRPYIAPKGLTRNQRRQQAKIGRRKGQK